MSKNLKTIFLLILVYAFCFPIVAAQSGGTGTSSSGAIPASSTSTSDSAASSNPTTPAATSSAVTTPAGGTVATSAPRVLVPVPKSKIPPKPTSITSATSSATSSAQNTLPPVDDEGNALVSVVRILIVAIPLGFIIAIFFKNKKKNQGDKDENQNKDSHGKCFDIKQLLDKKLEELTDIRGRIEDAAKENIRGHIDEIARGTKAGTMLELAEKAEEQYENLKKLYEECMADFGGKTFKGTIIENSLSDKSILDKLAIEKTSQMEDWIVHDVLVPEKQISELSKHMADRPWYIHLWEKGKDDVTVIFKDKVFKIKSSDKSTWKDAVAYGKSIGIPEQQLNFLTE